MGNFCQKYALIVLLFVSVLFFGIANYQKQLVTKQLEEYPLEKALALSSVEKNKPLIEELYSLGEEVKAFNALKAKEIRNPEIKAKRDLLNRMCKDSCKAVRCRIDAGLGHACRTNCPEKKTRACRLALKLTQKEKKNAS